MATRAFYGGNTGQRLTDSSGHGHDLMGYSAAVPNPVGPAPEGDHWLGAGFAASKYLQAPAGAWPGSGQGAIEMIVLYNPSVFDQQLFYVNQGDPSRYVSLFSDNAGFLHVDYVSSSGASISISGPPHMNVNNQQYLIRLEWDASGVVIRLNGVVVASSSTPLDLPTNTGLSFGANPVSGDSFLHGKLDALAILNDPQAQACDSYDHSPTPTHSATPTVTPNCAPLPEYTGTKAKLGDLLVTLRFGTSEIVSLDTSPGGTYSSFALSGDDHTDGIAVDYDDNAVLRVCRENNHDIVAFDSTGALIPGSSWTLPAGVDPKIGSFEPGTGDFYVPSQTTGRMFVVEHLTHVIHELPATGFANAIGTAFDGAGNLYITQNQFLSMYSAADLAAWRGLGYSGALVSSPYRFFGAYAEGVVYDGANTLYLVASDAVNMYLVTVPLGVPGLSNYTAMQPRWPASVATPGSGLTVGDPLGTADGLLMDINGDLWVTQNSASARGMAKMDVLGNVLDYRPLGAIAGTPDDVAVVGWKLPRPPVQACTPVTTPGEENPNTIGIARAGKDLKNGVQTWMPAGKDLVVGPNPANKAATVFFRMPEAGQAKVVLSNLLGETVLILGEEAYGAGIQARNLDLHGLASGLYFAQLLTNTGQGWGLRATFKVAVVR